MSSMSSKRVLIIAAHPDDELLGVGGTAALHAVNGDEVTSLIACAGELIHQKAGDNVRRDAHNAARVLGINNVKFLEFPDQGLDRYSLVDVIHPLEQAVSETKANVIYLQYGYDINRDHQILFQAALVAARPLEEHIEGVFAYDTVSSTEWAYPRSFVADTWVDISSVLDRKMEAMNCYQTELREWPHPRSLHSLRVKAESVGSQVCTPAAEAFMTIRRVTRNGKTPV